MERVRARSLQGKPRSLPPRHSREIVLCEGPVCRGSQSGIGAVQDRRQSGVNPLVRVIQYLLVPQVCSEPKIGHALGFARAVDENVTGENRES